MNVKLFSLILLLIISNIIRINRGQIIENYDPNVFHQKTDPKVYKSYLDPKKPIDVEISIKLLHFGPMNEKKSEFTVLLHLYVTWMDYRLAIEPSNSTKSSHLEIDESHLFRIWKPTIHFSNSIPFTPDILSNKLLGKTSGVITGDGKVFVIKKTQLNAACKFNIKFYPMDTQRCSIEIESSSLSSRNMHLKWSDEPIQIPSNFQWSDFDMKNLTIHTGKINYQNGGPYVRLVATFQLKRHVTHHLFNVYLPSTLFVISSWSSFWINIPAAPARVALVLTTMLTHVTSTKAIHDKLPKALFVSSLDIWIIMCTMFIFAAIIEYSTANYFYHKPSRIRDKKPTTESKQPIDSNSNLIENSHDNSSTNGIENTKSKWSYCWHHTWTKILPPFDENFSPRRVALEIDRRSRYIFPITFIIFNIFYWAILVIYSDNDE